MYWAVLSGGHGVVALLQVVCLVGFHTQADPLSLKRPVAPVDKPQCCWILVVVGYVCAYLVVTMCHSNSVAARKILSLCGYSSDELARLFGDLWAKIQMWNHMHFLQEVMESKSQDRNPRCLINLVFKASNFFNLEFRKLPLFTWICHWCLMAFGFWDTCYTIYTVPAEVSGRPIDQLLQLFQTGLRHWVAGAARCLNAWFQAAVFSLVEGFKFI